MACLIVYCRASNMACLSSLLRLERHVRANGVKAKILGRDGVCKAQHTDADQSVQRVHAFLEAWRDAGVNKGAVAPATCAHLVPMLRLSGSSQYSLKYWPRP